MEKAINQEMMRVWNRQRIFSVIRSNNGATKKEISDLLEISLTSVSTIVNELLSERKIMAAGFAKSSGGRRSEMFKIDPVGFYILGIDLQPHQIIFLLLDASQKILSRKIIPIESQDEWVVIDKLRQVIDNLLSGCGIKLNQVGGIGIAIPGKVDDQSETVEVAPNLGWRHVKLRELLKYNLPILVENEANAAAAGERTFGGTSIGESLIRISIGSGVGTGLVFNNHIFGGATQHAGEFGHMIINPAGPLCSCGNQGCWETYISDRAALSQYAQLSGCCLESYSELLALYQAENPHARTVINEIINYLSIGIANIINGLNPKTVIIGGQIAALKESIHGPLLKATKMRCLEKSFSKLSLKFSELGEIASALGVATMVTERVVANI